jgi:LysM repeat protein
LVEPGPADTPLQTPDTARTELGEVTPLPSDTSPAAALPTEAPKACTECSRSITATSTPIASPTAQPDGQIIYTVQAGDTLSLVADRFDLSLSNLYSYNNITAESIIQVGQQLLIGYGILPDGSLPLQGFPQAKVSPDGTIIHTVIPGDSFLGLAVTYDLTLEQFYDVSGLDENSVMQIGQEVVVGFRPQPQEVGGSTNPPPELASLTPTPTPALTPSPTITPDPVTPTAVDDLVPLQEPTALASETEPTPTLSAVEWAGSTQLALGIIGFLVLAGALLLYLRR